MSPEPQPGAHTIQSQLLQAATAVDRGLTRITSSLKAAHPITGCLPLPDLAAPLGADALYAYASEIEACLWADKDNWSPAWLGTLAACTHGLGAYGVSTAFGLVQAWRALISRAADHAACRRSADTYSLDERLSLLNRAAHNLITVSGGQ